MNIDLSLFKNDENFYKGVKTLFNTLNIPVNHIDEKPIAPNDILSSTFKPYNEAYSLMDDVFILGMVDDNAFEGVNNHKIEDIKNQKKDYDGILIFAVTLKTRENNLLPTRSQLGEITRAFNREFYYTPVAVVFKYSGFISLANAERLKYKQDWREGEKAGKVSILRDIDINNPHTGHLKILEELAITRSGKKGINSFDDLYKYWQDVFSVSLLSKKFYNELSNWYFWAIKHVTFPTESVIKDDKNQELKAQNVIRLLTRLLFVWFIKEKKLIPEELFNLDSLQKIILKMINPLHDEDGLFKESNKESIYYKAILQNLFFATLNCPIKPDSLDSRKRDFRGDDSYGKHRGVDWMMRYKDYFKDPDAFLEMVNKRVPFLNGGLFECLDDKDNKIYIDGFSDNMSKTEGNANILVVPDYLFFGKDESVDLSDDYGVKNKGTKEASVKGLINILKSYKFTIAENTPIEEDVALDPELLGKVFENLLASYNPETKTTARKQTGSFYTPREIVNYMVDESLIAHLKNSIDWEIEEIELDKQLHQLVSFDSINPFENNRKHLIDIIHSLDSCKILDPACGSGAFPMGILQKMVHILTKVDPDNIYWQDLQLDKAQQETKGVFAIRNKEEREQLLLEINEAFDETVNNPDYARKLFLIENCIYGVDIQPIAAQISKLRFFISLVVEQKVNNEKVNFGIRPLPNLETRFVTANTLIGIDKPDSELFYTKEVQEKESELKTIRHKLFGAKTKATKVKYRQKDKKLRNEIADILQQDGLPVDSAKQLASWDPYDQNGVSLFFDPEWMFDIKKGFDIIIGNPPWGAQLSKEDKALFKTTYPKIDSSTPNSFAYFIGEAINHASGIISFILPDSILIKDFEKTRELLKNSLYEISWYLNTGIPEVSKTFVYVEHDVCVLLINQSKETKHCRIKKYLYNFDLKKKVIHNYSLLKDEFIKPDHGYSYNLKIEDTEIALYKSIQDLPVLDQILQCHEGIHTGNSRDLLFHKEIGIGNFKPLFYGGRAGDIIRNYNSKTSGWYVDYRKELIKKENGYYASLRDERIFNLPKIYITRTGNPVKAFYDSDTYASNNFFSLQFRDYRENNKDKLRRILPLILSKFANYYIRTFAAPRLGDTFIETKIFHILKIPFADLILTSKELKDICSIIINCINKEIEYKHFQEIIDSLIFDIYFTDHMKERKIDIHQFIEKDINEVIQNNEFEGLSDSQKEQVIKELHTRWSDPDCEIVKRMNSFSEKSPDILKPILEG